MRVELRHAPEMLVGSRQVALLLEDDPRTEMRMRVIRILLQHPGQELKGFVEVAQRGAPSGLLRSLNLLAGHVEQCDGQVDRTGDPARRAPADLTKGLGRLAVLVLLHEAGSLEMSLHDRAQLGGGDLVLGGFGSGPGGLGGGRGLIVLMAGSCRQRHQADKQCQKTPLVTS